MPATFRLDEDDITWSFTGSRDLSEDQAMVIALVQISERLKDVVVRLDELLKVPAR
jgi:hypothetical protein